MLAENPSSQQKLHLLPPDRCRDEALIEMRDIVKTFKTADAEFTALKGVTACFFKGEFVSIVGKSGSGKSTLANMLTGIDHPTSGSVRVADTYIHKLSENEMSRWRGKNLGIVFQFFQLMPILTLLENVMLPMAFCNNCGAVEREKRAMMLLDLVGLASMADKLPAAVSGGQQQSAAIARALANDPPILIADEPTGNLDSRSADEVFDIFTNLVEEGKTILMVTHDPGLAQRTHRTLLLSDGELINPWVAQALPDLSHSHMLWLTHRLKAQTLPAGVSLPAPALFLVTDGNLEINNHHSDNGFGKMVVRPGQASGGALHRLNGNSQPGWQVSTGSPVEILTLDDTDLQSWLEIDSAVSQALAKDIFLPGVKVVDVAGQEHAAAGDNFQGKSR